MIKKLLAFSIALIMCVSVFASCNSGNDNETEETYLGTGTSTEKGTESENNKVEDTRFDYYNAQMSDYLTIDSSVYSSIDIKLSSDYLVTDKTVQDYIDTQRYEKRSKLNEGISVTDKAIELGDSAFIYYKGTVDGEEFEGGSNWSDKEPYELGIGSGKFIPGFEEGLIGIIPSQTSKEEPFALNVTFPETYGTDLAGKDAVFYVWVVYIVEYQLPEYNEDFIINVLEFVPESTDVKASYEKYVKELLEEEIIAYREAEIQNLMWEHILENVQVIKFPEGEVDYYYNSYIDQYEYYMEYYKYYGYSFKSLDEFVIAFLGLSEGADWKAETQKTAETDVTQNLVYHAIAQNEGIIITDTDYQNAIQYYVDYYKNQSGTEYTAEEIESGLGARMIKEYALFTKIAELLVSKCNVTYAD